MIDFLFPSWEQGCFKVLYIKDLGKTGDYGIVEQYNLPKFADF